MKKPEEDWKNNVKKKLKIMQCREALKREEQGKQNIKCHDTKKTLQKI